MDIASRVGVGSSQYGDQSSSGPSFAVSIVGLTPNLTYGDCAQRGVALTAVVTGLDQNAPSPSYQWTVDGTDVPGATSASFTPAASLATLADICCVVTVGTSSVPSPPVTLRDAPPEVQSGLYDEIFDFESGLQSVEAAVAFTGAELVFSVSGAGASIDTVTGEVSIPTDIETLGAVVTVTATNTGGALSVAFQVTVEDISIEGALPFGGLTPAGAGGVPVSGAAITQGDPNGHWEIVNGYLVPSAAGEGALAGLYLLVLDSGDTVDVMIEPDKASARPEEISDVFATLPTSARGLMVQDGDGRAVGRQRLGPKVFLAEMVMEPLNWVEEVDPRQSYRPVILAGLVVGGDPSGNEATRMENLTVQGFVCHMEAGIPVPPAYQNSRGSLVESDGFMGIIAVERPSRHVTIRQNEIVSRPLADIIAADDFRDNLRTSRQIRGITTKIYRGTNEHICIEENHIHDVSRGVMMTATSAYQGQRSRLCDNIIEDCYTNFFTCGYLDGLDIFDNKCMGVYAANDDTLGAVPQTSPHSACGGSFDAGGGRSTANVTMIGNLLHTGWKRTKIHADMGLPKPSIGATGVKFNDPQAHDSYWNLVVGFNTIISHGICMEMSGAGADTHIEVFNNTLASESYAGAGSGPVYYFVGADNVRLWNNIGTAYAIGSLDGSGMFSRTLDTLQGYGNLKINTGDNDPFGESAYFNGVPSKGLQQLTIDEALFAYTPAAGTGAAEAPQIKGAQGTGLYAGNGVNMAVFDKPEASGGVDDIAPFTNWNGSTYMTYSGSGAMLNLGMRHRQMLFAFEGQLDPALENMEVALFAMKSARLLITRSSKGALSLSVQNVNSGFLCRANSFFRLDPTDGLFRVAISYDVDQGRVLFAKNGVLDDFPNLRAVGRDNVHIGSNPVRVGADHQGNAGRRFVGQFVRLLWTPEFLDMETDAGINALFTGSGAFRDFGPDGSKVTGATPVVYVHGDASTLANHGNGGAFTLSGSVT